MNPAVAFSDPAVAQVFDAYSPEVRRRLLECRSLIFQVARETDGVGALEETLKWGQPSYLTLETRSGSTLRMDQLKTRTNAYALFFHCQTNLVDSFRERFGDLFRYEGNRALHFDAADEIPEQLAMCIEMTLTYHLRKRARAL